MKNIFSWFWQAVRPLSKQNIRTIKDINIGDTHRFILIPDKKHSTCGAYDYVAGGYLIVSDAQGKLWAGFLTLENKEMLNQAGFVFDYEINAEDFFIETANSAKLSLKHSPLSEQWQKLLYKESGQAMLVKDFLKNYRDDMRHIYKVPRKSKLAALKVYLI